MFVFQLLFVSLLLHQTTSSGSGGHSLWVLANYISGSTLFPEFSAVLMLDDIQVGYYDSVMNRLMRRGGEEGEELDLGQGAMSVLRKLFSDMSYRLTLVKDSFNVTTGIHVQQRLVGCEILQDGQLALMMARDGCNGKEAGSLMYNMTHLTYAIRDGWEIKWNGIKREYVQTRISNYYLPLCTRTLRHLLDSEKRLVTRRVQPRVHFITKQVVGGAQVTCMATDFYPRHINLTLLRDGRSVDEDQLTGGEVLPNGNGLYQVRKMLTVTDEEFLQRHNYTCAAAHLSPDNRLEVSCRAEFCHSHRIHDRSLPAVLTAAAVLIAAIAALLLLLWRRWKHTGQRSEGVAMETQVQPGEEYIPVPPEDTRDETPVSGSAVSL